MPPLPRSEALSRRDFLRGGAAAFALAAAPGCGGALALPPGRRLASFFALGDIGDEHGLEGYTAPQWLVARAMTLQHRAAPVEAIVFLGDHFYPDGLGFDAVEARVGSQIVSPYRDFVSLTPRARSLYGGPAETGPPVRLLAVLGNHDRLLPESPGLQIDELPRLVSNWRMSEREADTVDLGHGVRIALLHQEAWGLASPRRLAAALAEEPAEFWIVAGHFPLPRIASPHRREISDELIEVYREAPRRVHLQLCGHEHNLQVLRMEPPAPPVQVVSGGGSNTRALGPTDATRDFGSDSLGFARIDVLGTARAERLCVSLYEVDRWTTLSAPLGRLAARTWIDRDGNVESERFAPVAAAPSWPPRTPGRMLRA